MTNDSEMQVLFLQDGGQSATSIADRLAAFISEAKSSLDIAIYDAGLSGEVGNRVASAFNDAASRGVSVRFAYYVGPHHSPIIPPPVGTSDAFAAQLRASIEPITGYQALMHHKYVVRDWQSPDAAVWTGSMNWTGDSWTREENLILEIPSHDLAVLYHADFEQLWSAHNVDDSGAGAGGSTTVQFDGQETSVQVWFSPSEGEEMAKAVAAAIQQARERVVLASPVLTDGPILGALKDLVEAGGINLSGVYDATQMAEVREQWRSVPANNWKIDAFDRLVAAGRLAGKRSTPYGPGTVHDFMHFKAIVIDDSVFTGSYNFSRSGESNAENLLRFDSQPFADQCGAFIAGLARRYSP